MPLSDTEFRQLVKALEYPLRDRSQRDRILGMAFPNDPAKRSFATDISKPAVFAYEIVRHFYDKYPGDLVVLLQVIQEEEGGDLANDLQRYIYRLQAITISAQPKLTDDSASKPKLFTSYRRKSWAFTHRLVADLGKLIDADIFVDFNNIDEADFEQSILRNLRESDAVLLVISEYTFGERIHDDDDWVRREIALALRLNKPIIPVFADGLMPPSDLPDDVRGVMRFQGVAVYPEFWDAAVQRLTDLIFRVTPIKRRPLSNVTPVHLPLPTVAPSPARRISPVLLASVAALLLTGGVVAVLGAINSNHGNGPTMTQTLSQTVAQIAQIPTATTTISPPRNTPISSAPTVGVTIPPINPSETFDPFAAAQTSNALDLTAIATFWTSTINPTATLTPTYTLTENRTVTVAAAKTMLWVTAQFAGTKQVAIMIASYTKTLIPTSTPTARLSATNTATAIPPTATSTFISTARPSATNTATAIPPAATSTFTSTARPSAINTATAIPPAATSTFTATSLPTSTAALTTTSVSSDDIVTILNVIATEQEFEITQFYTALATNNLHFNAAQQAYMRAALEAKLDALDFLNAQGAKSLTDKFYFPMGTFKDINTFSATTSTTQSIVIAAYLAGIYRLAVLNQSRLAAVFTQIAIIDGQHMAVMREMGGVLPDDVAFAEPLFMNVSDSVSAVQSLLEGKQGSLGTMDTTPSSYPGKDAVMKVVGKSNLLTKLPAPFNTLIAPFPIPAQIGTDDVVSILNIRATAEAFAITEYYRALTSSKIPFTPAQKASLTAVLDSKQIHLDFLESNGGKRLTNDFFFPVGTFSSTKVFGAVASIVETMLMSTDLAAVYRFAELGQPALATTFAQIAMVDGQHLALLKEVAGQFPNDMALAAPIFAQPSEITPVIQPLLDGKKGALGDMESTTTPYPGKDKVLSAVGKIALRQIETFVSFVGSR